MNFSGISNKGVVGAVLRLPLRLLPSNARVPVLEGPLRGKRWIVGSGNHGCWLGSYEFAKQKLFSERIKRGDTVFDVGANVGFYSLLASVLVGPEGKVISFEPAPGNLNFLRTHMQLNKVNNCTIFDAAVGQAEGVGHFDLGPNSSMGHLAAPSQGGLEVQIVALDALMRSGQLPPPNVIKCDIEGAEFGALTGATETLSKYGPTIFLATHGYAIHQQCCGFLRSLGYSLTPIDGRPLERTDEILAVR